MSFLAKKSLGQNFLRSGSALAKIIEAGDVKRGDIVLEIGPGQGVLTEKLLTKGAKVFAVEKDDRLIDYLREKFDTAMISGNFTLIHKDILDFSPANQGFKERKYKIIANIPYYITGLIFRKFLEEDMQPSDMVILVQKEVADRIIARDGKESILSISVKAYGEPKIMATVPKGAFVPAPNVDSAILSIRNISKKNFKKASEETFFKILKAGFAHKRKKLSSNLKGLVSAEKLGPLAHSRAEDLTLSDWNTILSTIS